MWHDADTWQSLRNIWKLPVGRMIGDCLMAAQIAAGIGIQFRAAAPLAAIILGVIDFIFTLACLPDVFAAPATYLPYGNIFYQFSLVCGAIAVYAAVSEVNTDRAARLGGLARIGLGVCALSFTLSQIFYFRLTSDLVPKWIPPNRDFWATLTTVAFALAATAVLINRRARPAMRLMALMLGLFGLLVWVPALLTHPEAHGNWSEFAVNFLIAGAVWAVADLTSFERER